MKVRMVAWVGGIKNLPTWFKHGEDAEVSWAQVEELFATGNNVMISHADGEEVNLFVDNRRFTQR